MPHRLEILKESVNLLVVRHNVDVESAVCFIQMNRQMNGIATVWTIFKEILIAITVVQLYMHRMTTMGAT